MAGLDSEISVSSTRLGQDKGKLIAIIIGVEHQSSILLSIDAM